MNGERCEDPGRRVDPARDVVLVDGERARLPRPATIVLHKPAGVLVTLSDPQGRRTIVDFLRRAPEGVVPVGRLDRASEGLLVLTNDGDLAFRLAHPRFGVERTYRAWVRGEPSPERLRALERGVVLSDGWTAPATVHVEKRTHSGAVLRLALREGKNREVRRMCGVVGLRVERLVRIAYGPLRLGGLAPGAWRALGDAEVAALRSAVGLPARGFAPDPVRTRPGRATRRAPSLSAPRPAAPEDPA